MSMFQGKQAKEKSWYKCKRSKICWIKNVFKSLFTLKNADVRNGRAGELPQPVSGNSREFNGFVIEYKGLHNEWEMNGLKF